MSQTLLFAIGAVVFAIMVCAILLYGYSLFSNTYEESVADELSLRLGVLDADGGDFSSEPAPASIPVAAGVDDLTPLIDQPERVFTIGPPRYADG